MRRALLLAALLLVPAACRRDEPPSVGQSVEVPFDEAELPSEREFESQLNKSMGFRDWLETLHDPPFVPAAEAPRMSPEEPVLGLDLGDVQIAFPVRYMSLHEAVEATVGGRPILVCWCPLCGTGVVHDRRVGGRTLTFGQSGWLWRNSMLVYDTETESQWHNVTGVAMSGPLRGSRMRRFTGTALMSFAAWRAEHPQSLVLEKPADPAIPVESDGFADRNKSTHFGLALDLAGAQRFFPFDTMSDLDAVEEDVGGTPVVVVRDATAGLALAFDRRVGGRTLSFDVVPGPRPELRERGGWQIWYLRSGDPDPGSGATARLVALPATPFEVTAWMLQHPAGSIRQRR